MGVLYVGALAYPVHRHVVGAFSDFYVRFAPDADRVAAGEFPRNTYNPPGYPMLLVLASPLTGDHFTTGKWMSLLAGGLTGALAFVLFRRLFDPGPALLAVPIILTSAVFATYAITAMTDVPFVLLCLIVMIAITSEGPTGCDGNPERRAVRHRLPHPVQRRVPPRAGPGGRALGRAQVVVPRRSGPRMLPASW